MKTTSKKRQKLGRSLKVIKDHEKKGRSFEKTHIKWKNTKIQFKGGRVGIHHTCDGHFYIYTGCIFNTFQLREFTIILRLGVVVFFMFHQMHVSLMYKIKQCYE